MLEEIIDVCGDIIDNGHGGDTIADWDNVFPITEHTKWKWKSQSEVKRNPTDQRFYVVNGSMMHDVISIKNLKVRAQHQYYSYGARAIQAKNNNGVDWKAVSHCLRAAYQLKEIYINGDFEYPLKETQFILDVKLGKLDYSTQVGPEIDRVVDEITELSKTSNLPDKVDVGYWEEYVFDVYHNGR